MDEFHLDDVLGHRVQFSVPCGERFHTSPVVQEGATHRSVNLMDSHGMLLCRLFESVYPSGNHDLYLGYPRIREPRIIVRIVEKDSKLASSMGTKILSDTIISLIIERAEELTTVVIGV